MKGLEGSFASSWQRLWPHGRRECTRRKESWYPRKRSKAVTLLGQLRSSGNLEALFAEHFALAGEKIGHFGRLLGFRRQQAGDYTFALGDVDFFAFAEEFFHFGEAVAEVADGGFLHVIHFSITCAGRAEIFCVHGDKEERSWDGFRAIEQTWSVPEDGSE
jgi:hypothetical protein